MKLLTNRKRSMTERTSRRDEKPPQSNVHKWKLFVIVLHFRNLTDNAPYAGAGTKITR